ncbi:MAG TPA: hypothetical protein VGJ32_02215, partial [Solirubrobacteraceae bacterium]
MRIAAATLVLALLGAATALVLALRTSRDPTPNALRACAQRAGAKRVTGLDRLGPLRVDLLRGGLRETDRRALDRGDQAVLLAPADRAYRVLVLVSARRPARDVVATLGRAPETLALVAYAVGPRAERRLAACLSPDSTDSRGASRPDAVVIRLRPRT